jgi:tripartite-type tricarboxylate transporter receptor subunit TctC
MGAVRFILQFILVAAALALHAPAALAQAWPAKPIRFIVTFPPGGSSDLVARALAPRMSERLGQQVLVENRPGAGGNIGADLVAKAPADGYTIGLSAAGALSINASLYPSMPFDPVKDLAPVSLLALIPIVIAAHPSANAANVRELIAAAKARPGALSYGTTGNGSAMHLAGELLQQMTGIRIVHVPYKGSGPAAADAAGGQLPLAIVDLTSALPHIKAGRMRALAVTGAQRSVTAPEIPTVAETGVPGFDAVGWFGVVAPAGTPAPVIARLNAEIVEGMKVQEIRERLLAGGAEPATSTPEEFGAFVRAETAKWARVIKVAGVKLD